MSSPESSPPSAAASAPPSLAPPLAETIAKSKSPEFIKSILMTLKEMREVLNEFVDMTPEQALKEDKETDPELNLIVAHEMAQAKKHLIRATMHIMAAYPPLTEPSEVDPKEYWNHTRGEEENEWDQLDEATHNEVRKEVKYIMKDKWLHQCLAHIHMKKQVEKMRPDYAELLSKPPSLIDKAAEIV